MPPQQPPPLTPDEVTALHAEWQAARLMFPARGHDPLGMNAEFLQCLKAFGLQREARATNAQWFALVMNASAALEDAANHLRDPAASRAAHGAAKHYRTAARAMWKKCGPNTPVTGAPGASG